MNVNVITSSVTGPPQASVTIRADGKVEALFCGIPRANYLIERSPDLVNWTPMQTLPAGDDGLLPVLYPAPPADHAFYRARAQ